MTVAKLIEQLSKMDQDLEVFAYDVTDEAWCGRFKVSEETEFPYVKADPPSDLPGRFVLLNGYEY